MWRKMLSGFTGVALSRPTSEAALLQIEERLGRQISGDLRSLLLESDGLEDTYGVELVWSAARTLEENLAFRSNGQYRELYMPFDALMFFGDNGGGDQFAYVRNPVREDVFVWGHEADSRTWIAPNLETFLRRSLESDGEDWYR